MHDTITKQIARSQKGGLIPNFKGFNCGFRKITKKQRKMKLATHKRIKSQINGKEVITWVEHKERPQDLLMNAGAGKMLGLICSVTMTPEQC